MDGYPLFMVQMIIPESSEAYTPEPIDMEADAEASHDDCGEDEYSQGMDPDDSYPIPALQRAQPMTSQQARLLSMCDQFASIPDPNSDEGMEKQMDMVFGDGVVPMYQYYDIGGWLDLSTADKRCLDKQLFDGKKHEDKDIEVMTLGGRWVLKIKHAKERQVRIQLQNKEYRLIKVYHYPKPKQPELSISFPIRRY